MQLLKYLVLTITIMAYSQTFGQDLDSYKWKNRLLLFVAQDINYEALRTNLVWQVHPLLGKRIVNLTFRTADQYPTIES